MTRLPMVSPREVRQWLWHTLHANKEAFGVICALSCFGALLGLVGPQILGYLVDSVFNNKKENIDLLATAFGMTLIVRGYLKWWEKVRARALSEKIMADTRETFISNALALPLDKIESGSTGDLLSRITADISRVDNTAQNAGPEILSSLMSIVLIVVAMIVMSPLLSAGLLVSVPLLVGVSVWYSRRNPTAMIQVLDSWGVVQADLHETAVGAGTIEALGLRDKRVRSNRQALEQALASEQQQRRLEIRWRPCVELAYALPIAVILLIGYWAYSSNQADVGTITTELLYAQALVNPLVTLLLWIEKIQVAEAALHRILGVRSERKPKQMIAPREKAITLDKVRFGYSANREVLRGIDLHIPQGERLAIVGPSGAGKSTIGRLIAGFSAPTSGFVRIGDCEVSTLDEKIVRGEVMLLTQEQYVFAGSLRDNLTLPAGEWTDEQLLAALHSVGAEEWVSQLPKGLDTELGSSAQAVPAAVAQQLALARVILADPHTVVLDEATSLLDTSVVRKLEHSLNTVLSGRTVIAIAHRLHTAAAADRVVVLEGGLITELGSHDELIAANGPYARLHHAAKVQ